MSPPASQIAFPAQGVLSPRASIFEMVDKIEVPDPTTVVIHLKFATSSFLPALANPYNWIYEKRSSTRTRTGSRPISWARVR